MSVVTDDIVTLESAITILETDSFGWQTIQINKKLS